MIGQNTLQARKGMIRRGAMDKCCVLKMVDNVLRNGPPRNLYDNDIVALWKDAPLEPLQDIDYSDLEPLEDFFDLGEPEIPGRPDLLELWISRADEERSAREDLRRLVRYLLEEGEDIPEPLRSWVHREFAGLNPPVKRGRPALRDRDTSIAVGYLCLCILVPDFSHEDAIEFIACRINRDIETVRPIVRDVWTGLGFDWRGLREQIAQETS